MVQLRLPPLFLPPLWQNSKCLLTFLRKRSHKRKLIETLGGFPPTEEQREVSSRPLYSHLFYSLGGNRSALLPFQSGCTYSYHAHTGRQPSERCASHRSNQVLQVCVCVCGGQLMPEIVFFISSVVLLTTCNSIILPVEHFTLKLLT